MGLLDEAIREHLELKRRSGGDPSEIAHQEREALDPVFPEAGPSAGEAPAESEAPVPAADFSSVGQETAEIDMQAVLDADGFGESATAEPAAAAPAQTDEGSFEWDVPPAEGEHAAEPGPGQERLDFE
jgi:hypothetical protein